MKARSLYIPVMILTLVLAHPSSISAAEDLQTTINYLIDTVAKSDAAFIRNDKPHTGKDAAEHMRQKYEHFKDKIKTPEDFIRLAGSKSLVTGKPYRVKMKNGEEIPCEKWLGNILRKYRERQRSDGFSSSR